MRSICVVTSSRADFGLLKPLLQAIKLEASLKLKLVATGTHLSSAHGYTLSEILDEGFEVSATFDFSNYGDAKESIASQISSIIKASLKYFLDSQPDVIVVLGDRFEIFAAVTSAHLAGIPVAHIHGGEVTQDSLDDAFRHSITKLSCLHFVSNQDHKRRVIQLGENPNVVFNVGALGLENILMLKSLTKSQLSSTLDISFKENNFLITMHPNSLSPEKTDHEICSVLDVLEELKDSTLIFTAPNGDEGSLLISMRIREFCERNKNSFFFESLGTTHYLQLAQHMDAVIGNSSSGIIEIPSLGVPTINIGSRQLGRPQASSIINCRADSTEIKIALDGVFKTKSIINEEGISNPYGSGNASQQILNILKTIDLEKLKGKKFYDITQINYE